MKRTIKPWIIKELKEMVAERAFKVAKRLGGEQVKWDNYRRLKNLTNRKIEAVEASYRPLSRGGYFVPRGWKSFVFARSTSFSLRG